MSSNNKNKNNLIKDIIRKIRFGIIIQNSPFIKINELFELYFEKSKPIIIKKEQNEYEFTLKEDKNFRLIFDILTDELMGKIQQIYSSFNFFMIFIDIQNSTALKNLENDINKLTAYSYETMKKFYIFGAFQENNLIVNKKEKINTILNCKGIDFEYSELNINSNEDFQKRMELVIEDIKEILEEQESEEFKNKMEGERLKSCKTF